MINSGLNTSWLWPQSIHTQYMQRRTKYCTVIAKPRRHVCTVHKFVGIVLEKKIRVIFSWHVLRLYICRNFVLWTISGNQIHVQNKLWANAITTDRTLNKFLSICEILNKLFHMEQFSTWKCSTNTCIRNSLLGQCKCTKFFVLKPPNLYIDNCNRSTCFFIFMLVYYLNMC